MNRVKLVFWVLMVGSVAFGQELPNIIPPSPNAAALGQYGDIPVSNYTGVPNISIPLYTVKSGDIEVPISISYHASGIKVAQEASWVGLGWVLNAGGVITRQIRGIDDFSSTRWGYVNMINNDIFPQNNESNLPLWKNTTSENVKLINDYKNILHGNYDGEPDIFYYNFLNYSGKLIIKEVLKEGTLKFISLDQNNLTFSCDRNGENWIITDGNGWKYHFGNENLNAVEKTENFSISEQQLLDNSYYEYDIISNAGSFDQGTTAIGSREKNTAWYLTKIETSNGEIIEFEYRDGNFKSISQISDYQSIERIVNYVEIHKRGGYISPNSPLIPNLHRKSQRIDNNVYLEKIKFINGHITFNSEDRDDIKKYGTYSFNPQRLDNIEVFSRDDGLIKKIDFNYSYFNDNKANDKYPENFLRLRLDSVQEFYDFSKNRTAKNPYLFKYNDSNTGLSLPEKTSFSIDHWGYYNGHNNRVRKYPLYNSSVSLSNTAADDSFLLTLTPYFFGTSNSKSDLLFTQGANREVDTNKVKTASLKSIVYPTGGKLDLLYESNDYYDDINNFTNYESEWVLLSVQDSPETNLTINDREKEFIIDEITPALLDIFIYDYEENNFQSIGEDFSSNIQARLVNIDTGFSIRVNPRFDETNTDSSYDVHASVILEPGTYKIQANYQNFNQRQIYLDIQVGVRYLKKTTTTKKTGGGLRIKSVLKSTDNESYIKDFKYESISGYSTGRLLSPLKYFYTETFINTTHWVPMGGIVINLTSLSEHLFSNSSSVLPMGSSAQGKSIGYDMVSVINRDNKGNELGSSNYYYKNTEEVPV